MARKRVLSLIAACVLAAAGTLLPSTSARALVNVTATLELDGNVTSNGKDDWATVNTGGGSASIVARTKVIADPAPMSIYTGGGSKDDLDLNGALSGAGGWKSKDGSVPDKDNIVNAYAAAYNVSGDLVVYAGAERFDNSGDAFMGFWFFKSKISVNANGSFSGTHTVGDVLVLANFQGGGTTVGIQVLEWNPAQANVNGTLKLLVSDANAKCSASSNPLYCGITNPTQGGAGEPPWAYTSKSGTSTFLPATFLEVGINISQVLLASGDTSSPCFSSFLAETRSSSSVSATLKDFVLGEFAVCGVQITKNCSSGVANVNGTSIDYSFNGVITNTGFGTLTNVTLTDTPQAATPNPTVGPFSYYQCTAADTPDFTKPLASASPLAAGAEVCYVSSFNTTNNGSTNSIKVVANTTPPLTTDATSNVATCPSLTFPTGIVATKACTASLVSNGSMLFVKVDISGTVCNQGSLALTNVFATDFVGGSSIGVGVPLVSTTLGPKASATECTTFSGSYIPAVADLNTTTQFSDAVSAQGTPPAITGVPFVKTAVNAGATCGLCPAGVACTTSSGATASSLLKQLKSAK